MSLHALIVGLGSIGQRHLTNLRQLYPEATITVLRRADSNSISAESLADYIVYGMEDALANKPQVALIASPAPFHIPIAIQLAEAGVHLLVEKPLATNPGETTQLLDVCARRQLVLMVGYTLRFAPSLQALQSSLAQDQIGRPLSIYAEVGQYLPDWRPSQEYRQSVTARQSLGGGVLLELSHEIDYARWIMGEIVEISAFVDRLSGLAIDVEDIAEITVRFASGALGHIHLDMVQRVPYRMCRVVGTEGTLVWDGIKKQTKLYSPGQIDGVSLCEEMNSGADMYVSELRHFLDCVAGKTTPFVTGENGKRVLEIVEAIRHSAISGQKVTV